MQGLVIFACVWIMTMAVFAGAAGAWFWFALKAKERKLAEGGKAAVECARAAEWKAAAAAKEAEQSLARAREVLPALQEVVGSVSKGLEGHETKLKDIDMTLTALKVQIGLGRR